MRILIIRHGDPDYRHDSLTEKGFREAELLSQKLAKENIRAIYCSPLGRARATAEPTCRKLGTEPVILDWLREFPARAIKTSAGDGICVWNVEPSYWTSFPENTSQNWRESPMYRGAGVGERYDLVCAEFDKLTAAHGYVRDGMLYRIQPGHEDDDSVIAIFCHLGLGNSLLAHITGVPLPQWWHTVFLPTSSVTTVFMERHLPDKPLAIGRLVGIGDTSHLYAGNEPVSGSGLLSPLR